VRNRIGNGRKGKEAGESFLALAQGLIRLFPGIDVLDGADETLQGIAFEDRRDMDAGPGDAAVAAHVGRSQAKGLRSA
jgi:hypothetical protein